MNVNRASNLNSVIISKRINLKHIYQIEKINCNEQQAVTLIER